MREKDCVSHAPGNLFVGVVAALNERDVDIIIEECNEFLPPCLDEVFFFFFFFFQNKEEISVK